MINWNKYIGIPYAFNGRNPEISLDCIGLLITFYRDQGWNIDFDDGLPIEPDWFSQDKYRFARYMLKHFDRAKDINELSEGDILMFEINSESHVAIWCGYGVFLSTYPKISISNGGVSFRDRMKYYPHAIITGLFKRRS